MGQVDFALAVHRCRVDQGEKGRGIAGLATLEHVGIYWQVLVDDGLDDAGALLEPWDVHAGARPVAVLWHAIEADVGDGVGLIAADAVHLLSTIGEGSHRAGVALQ